MLLQLLKADGWMDGLWVITFEGEERAYKIDANQSLNVEFGPRNLQLRMSKL